MAHNPAFEDSRQRLARIRQMWLDLQAVRKDPVKYEAIAERMRRETDVFRQVPVTSARPGTDGSR